ncbi:MAG: phosphotransferase family protein [Dehalococcoidia bacterium]|nr:phosphotransferase family protein [Dehalococcoidia bacterium]
MDGAAVAKYLGYRLPEARNLAVTSLTRVFPGISRETWLVDTAFEEEGRAASRGFTFRMDTPGGSIVPLPLSYEYEVYRRLQGTDIRVARVLWYERDREWLMDGREFYVREKVEGAVDIPHLGDPAYRDMHVAMAKEHAEQMAKVHTLDWRKHGFAEMKDLYPEWRIPADAAQSARLDLELWEEIFYRIQPEPYPAMAQVLAWLKEHCPTSAPRVTLVKGNNGMTEEIWQGTKIAAMSDWELTHLGDPTEDWGWAAQQGLGQLWDFEQILAHYEQVSGIRVDRDSLRYYRLFVPFKAFVCLQAGARMFIAGKDLRVQVAGLTFMSHQFLAQLAAAAGV